MRRLTKSEQLNYTIKRMVKLALKETKVSDTISGGYYVDGTKLYTVTGDTVSDAKVILGSGTVVGTKLILQ